MKNGEFLLRTGLTSSVLEGYESKELIKPKRDKNGYREYTDEDVRIAIEYKNSLNFRRTYHVDKNYFDLVDSSDKAYWLGFLWGDGTVGDDSVTLALCTKDIEHLDKFKKCIKSNHPIKIFKHNVTRFNRTGGEYCRVCIYSKDMVNVIHNNYGIFKGREDFSKTLENVPKEFHRDLLRGLIDSDGSVFIKDRYNISLSLIASDSVLDFYESFINDITGNIKKYKRSIHRNGYAGVKTIQLGGAQRIFFILHSIYQNSNIYLGRKYSKYLWLLDDVKVFCKDIEKGNGPKNLSIVKYKKVLLDTGVKV